MSHAPADGTTGDPASILSAGDPVASATGTKPEVGNEPGPAPGIRDIVTGPIGSARLTEPSAPGIHGADPEGLDPTLVTSTD